MMSLSNDISIKLREKRARVQLTIEDASKDIGISNKTLSAIEKGKKNRIHKGVYEKVIKWLLIDE